MMPDLTTMFVSHWCLYAYHLGPFVSFFHFALRLSTFCPPYVIHHPVLQPLLQTSLSVRKVRHTAQKDPDSHPQTLAIETCVN